MRTLKLIILFAFLAIFSPLTVYAQFEHEHGVDCLGVWCSIDVHLESDPTEGGYASYPFPHSPEKIGPMLFNNGYPMYGDVTYFNCAGPGQPYITVYGNEPVLHINLEELKYEPTIINHNNSNYIEATVEFPVQKQAYVLGSGPYQCYYHIRLVVWLNT